MAAHQTALIAAGVGLILAGCSPSPCTSYADWWCKSGTDLGLLDEIHDWEFEPGDELDAAWNSGVEQLLRKMSKPDVVRAIKEAGFACTYSDGQEEDSNPVVQCTREYSTQTCQMNWDVSLTPGRGSADKADSSFKRDCALSDRDWPDKVNSAINDGLAPQMPPAAPN